MGKAEIQKKIQDLYQEAIDAEELPTAKVLAALSGALYINKNAEWELARICGEFAREAIRQIDDAKIR